MIAKVILIALFATIALAYDCPVNSYTCSQIGGACSDTAACNTQTSYCKLSTGSLTSGTCTAYVSQGGACTGVECGSNLYCSIATGSTSGTCQPMNYLNEGATDCTANGYDCKYSNDYCNSTTKACTKRSPIGSSCVGNRCQQGASCVAGVCVAYGSVALGGACAFSDSACGVGAYCGFDSNFNPVCMTAKASSNTPCSANGVQNQTACSNSEYCGCNPATTTNSNYVCYGDSGNDNTLAAQTALGTCLQNAACDLSGTNTYTCSSCKTQFCTVYKPIAQSITNVQQCIYPQYTALISYCNGAASVVASFATILVAFLVVM